MPNSSWHIRQRNADESAVSVEEAVRDFLASSDVKRLNLTTQNEYNRVLPEFAQWCATHTISQDKKTKTWSVIAPRAKHDAIALSRVDDQVVHLFLEHVKATHTPARAASEQLSTHTLANYAKCIKRLLNWCLMDEQYSEHVKAITVQRVKKPKIEETIIETFSAEQLEALFAACLKEESEHLQIRDKAILLVLLDTGIRAQELVTLTIGHVHLEASDAHIRVYGKGSKWREVGLGEEARRAVQKYIRQFREPTIEHRLPASTLPVRQRLQVNKQLIQQERLFVNRAGNPLGKTGLYQIIERLGQWAQIEGVRCSPHTFRHTFAVSFMRANNNDIYRLSRLLGHTSVRVTENYLKSWRQSEARKGAKSVADNR